MATPPAGSSVTCEGRDKQHLKSNNLPAHEQAMQRPASQTPSWYNQYYHPYASGGLAQWMPYPQGPTNNLQEPAAAQLQQWQGHGSPSIVHASVLTQSPHTTSTMSASPVSSHLQNGRPTQPDNSARATPSSQDAINPCEVPAPSSPLPPSSSPTLIRSLSSHTSLSASDSDSESQQSNSKRRRQWKSGSGFQKRIRVSQKNPSHGMVEGAMMGNKAFDVPRQQPLREPEEDKSKANQRFARQIKDIISRVERLALETNPWVIICAQQPGAGPAIHYESPRLRVEAMDEATTMVRTFQEAIQALNLAKVMDAKSITQDYEKKIKCIEESKQILQKEKEAAHLEASKAREDESAIKAELAKQKLLVAAYEARLAEK